MRRSELKRKTPLRSVARPSRPLYTGPSKKVRELVKARDGGCVICGTTDPEVLIIHHRVNRGSGGSKDPAINRCSNLALACRRCNTDLEADAQFAEWARSWGIKVRRPADPRLVRIKHYFHGVCYLLDDGSFTYSPTVARAAVAVSDRQASA